MAKDYAAISKKIVEGFQKKNGATVCKDLKGVETGHPLRSCDGCIEDAAKILEQVMGLQKTTE